MRAQHHIRRRSRRLLCRSSLRCIIEPRTFGRRSLVWTPSGHVPRDESLVAGPPTYLRLPDLSLWQRFTPGTRCDSAIATFTMTIVSVPRATRSTSSTGRAAIAAARGAYTARGWSRRPSRPHSPGCEPASRLHRGHARLGEPVSESFASSARSHSHRHWPGAGSDPGAA
jgi:hypothetical protein